MSIITKLEIDVYDLGDTWLRPTACETLVRLAACTGRESWADFNGTMLKARPSRPEIPADKPEDVENRWLSERPAPTGVYWDREAQVRGR